MNYAIVDAFASVPFTGNPAAIVPLTRALDDTLLQKIAGEFNLAETAFPLRLDDGQWLLRWFTPMREVPLCGHATLAAAHALWEAKLAPRDRPLLFQTRSSGTLTCLFRDNGWIQMEFPDTPAAPAPLPPNAAEVLRVPGPVTCVGTRTMNLTLRLPTAQQVRDANPDLARLAAWHPVGVTITAPSDIPDVDFVSRFFAPNAGIPEDPVTGSAHCTLAPYWSAQTGKTFFRARQLSPRTGELHLELKENRVLLLGQAVTTMTGSLACLR